MLRVRMGMVDAPCIDVDGGRSNEPIRHQIDLIPEEQRFTTSGWVSRGDDEQVPACVCVG
jgi:hypothetical protein